MAGLYPPPLFPVVVEPFAGSAAYSMYHLDSLDRVLLFEKDERVCETWWRLLAMTPEEVLAYPVPKAGETTSDFLAMTTATSSAIARCNSMTVTPRIQQVMPIMLGQISRLVERAAKKVEVVCADYAAAANIEATWFVDPPYQQLPGTRTTKTVYPRGMGYRSGCDSESIDYERLAEWCLARRGQRIVCEQAGAAWLPFQHLAGSRDALGAMRAEVVWTDPEHQLRLPVS